MTDSAALARQLAELDKVATPGSWVISDGVIIPQADRGKAWATVRWIIDGRESDHGAIDLCVALRNNLPAILRALCVMAAVGEYESVHASWINERADELLADLGSKDGNG